MNKVIEIGRNTKEPELNFLAGNGTAICKFSIAVDRDYSKDKDKKEVDFFNCVAFGKTAEYVANYARKGKLIAVDGRLQTGNYTNKQNVKVYTTDIIANQVQILEWGEKSEKKDDVIEGVDDVTNFEDGEQPF